MTDDPQMPLGIALFELASKMWMTKSPRSQNSNLWHFILFVFSQKLHIRCRNHDFIIICVCIAQPSRGWIKENKERGGGGREWKKGEKWHNDVIIIIAKPGRCHGDRDMWAGRWHSQWGCSDLLFTSSTEREGVFLDKRCSDLRKGGVTQRRDGGVWEK